MDDLASPVSRKHSSKGSSARRKSSPSTEPPSQRSPSTDTTALEEKLREAHQQLSAVQLKAFAADTLKQQVAALERRLKDAELNVEQAQQHKIAHQCDDSSTLVEDEMARLRAKVDPRTDLREMNRVLCRCRSLNWRII